MESQEPPQTTTIETSGKVIGTRTIKPEFGKYITRNRGFVEHLRGVRNQIDTYINKSSVKRPLNILLAAPPGSGKSFLIKQLISSIDAPVEVSFEEIYVASLEHVSELYGIFQRVQSVNLEGKIPVVFFDEIDSGIAGSALYAKFLAPMWDGTFYLGKEKYYLGRSVFFFAGSTLSLEDESAKILDEHKQTEPLSYEDYFDRWKAKFDGQHKNQTNKLPDFMDRIDAIVRIPPMREQLLGADWQAEYEDLACMLILKHFPTVKFVGKLTLELIRNTLVDANSMRTAEKIIFNSRLEDEDIFDLSCLPAKYQRQKSGPSTDLVEGKEKFVWQIDVEKPAKRS